MRSGFSLLELIIVISISSTLLVGVSRIFSNLYQTYFQTLELHEIDSKLSNANLQLSKLLENSISQTIKFDGKKLEWFGKSPELSSKAILKIANLNSSNSTHLQISEMNISLFNQIFSSFENQNLKIFFDSEGFSGNFSKLDENYFFISKNFQEIFENFEVSFLKFVLQSENRDLYLIINEKRVLFLEDVSFFDFNSTDQRFEICISDLCQKRVF